MAGYEKRGCASFRQKQSSASGDLKAVFLGTMPDHQHPTPSQKIAAADGSCRRTGRERGHTHRCVWRFDARLHDGSTINAALPATARHRPQRGRRVAWSATAARQARAGCPQDRCKPFGTVTGGQRRQGRQYRPEQHHGFQVALVLVERQDIEQKALVRADPRFAHAGDGELAQRAVSDKPT